MRSWIWGCGVWDVGGVGGSGCVFRPSFESLEHGLSLDLLFYVSTCHLVFMSQAF